MRAFTHDVESTELGPDELAAYAGLVKELCYPDLQSALSAWLSDIQYAQTAYASTYVGRQVERLWRTESRM